MLSDHPDKLFVSYVLRGMEEEIRIGFCRKHEDNLHAATRNMLSADRTLKGILKMSANTEGLQGNLIGARCKKCTSADLG